MVETAATEWQRRVRRGGDESARRRAARAALRREMATRRRHGLAARHATKLIRRDEAAD